MTPAARIAAAITCLDDILAGAPAEKVLTNWGRSSRFAGSGDRDRVRDHVYQALRCKRSFAWAGGAATGRGLMLGALRLGGLDPSEVFTGMGHAPAPIGVHEIGQDLANAPRAVRLDMPDWLLARLDDDLGAASDAVCQRQRDRAPVFLRVNLTRVSRDAAIASLAAEGIAAEPHALADSALLVREKARSVHRSAAYVDGLVELQDAASQAVVYSLSITKGLKVLDYCAGGGGKSLALAALGAQVSAHDVNAPRMRDIAPRAARAQVKIDILTQAPRGNWPLVLVDAPCSGSGTFARDPEAKWRLTPEKLAEIVTLQGDVLDRAADRVADGGQLAYVTCSVLDCENAGVVTAFLNRKPTFTQVMSRSFSPLLGGDGFGLAVLQRG